MHVSLDKMEFYGNIFSQFKVNVTNSGKQNILQDMVLRFNIKNNVTTKENDITEIIIMLPIQSVTQVIMILKNQDKLQKNVQGRRVE